MGQGFIELKHEKSILSAQVAWMDEHLEKARNERRKYQELLKEYQVSTQYVKQRLRQTIIEVEELKKANQLLMNTIKAEQSKRAPAVEESWEDDED